MFFGCFELFFFFFGQAHVYLKHKQNRHSGNKLIPRSGGGLAVRPQPSAFMTSCDLGESSQSGVFPEGPPLPLPDT